MATRRENNGDALLGQENLWFLRFYALIGMMAIVFMIVRSICSAYHRLEASFVLHSDMRHSTFNAPVSFFDITPTGRIFNRFSSDMETVDSELSGSIIQLVACVINVMGWVAAIAISTKGTFLILMTPLFVLYYKWQHYFRKTSTELKRLTNVSRSPIYSDFSAMLNGVVTIRAFRDEQRFISEIEKKININTISFVLSELATQWLAIRLDANGALISFFVAALAAATVKQGFIPPGLLALALSISFEMTAFLRPQQKRRYV